MNSLQVFTYESNDVRTVFREGEPWWVAKDVCGVFGETNYRRSIQALDEDEKGVSQMYTPGGTQNMVVVNESGLYAMLFAMQPAKARGVSDAYIKQREEKLRSFKRWVTHEVLPSIRRTGKYAMPKAAQPRRRPVDIIFRQRLNMARDFAKITGIPLEIACAKAIEDAEKITGEDYTHWKLSLPARLNEAPIPHLNATGIGALAGVTARDANRQLAAAGLQRRVGKSWRLTEAGMRHGEEYPFERNGHSDYRILWRDSAADVIKEAHNDA